MDEQGQIDRITRRVIRTQVTRNCNVVDDIAKKQQRTLDDIDVLHTKKLNLVQFRDELREIDKAITAITPEDKLDKELDDVAEYGDRINLHLVRAERLINEYRFPSSQVTFSGASSPTSGTVNSVSVGVSTLNGGLPLLDLPLNDGVMASRVSSPRSAFKLPTLEIEHFSGDPTEWTAFWEQFENAVGRYDDISNVEKLRYLRTLLRGPPLDMIKPLRVIDSNYKAAVDRLKERYEEDQQIRKAHFQAICRATPITSAKNLEAIRRLESSISVHVNELLNFNVDQDIVFENVVCLFPVKFIRRFLENEKELKTPTDLLKFIRKELNFREKWRMNQTLPNSSMDSSSSCSQQLDEVTQDGTSTTSMLVASDKPNIRRPSYCLFCDVRGHWGRACMAKLSLQTKLQILNTRFRCLCCFKPSHVTKECTFPYKLCERCNGKHFVAVCPQHPYAEFKDGDVIEELVVPTASLHVADEVGDDSDDQDYASVAAHFVAEDRKKTVLMQTAEIKITTQKGDIDLICLLDSGSQRSFLLSETADEMGIDQQDTEALQIEGFAAQSTIGKFPRVKIVVRGRESYAKLPMEALVVPQLTNYRPQSRCVSVQKAWRRMNELGLRPADSRTRVKPRKIQLIIGADFLNRVFTGKTVFIDKNLVAYETAFGWTLQGLIEADDGEKVLNKVACSFAHVFQPVEEELNTTLKKFWELDSIGIKEQVNEPVVNYDVQFRRELQFNGAHYAVALPCLPNKKDILLTNRNVALTRFQSTLRRLRRNDSLFKQYDDAISIYEADGHAEKVIEDDLAVHGQTIYYLPHHPVIDPLKSTPVRIVFDASSHEDQELSLNDCLFTGSNLKIDVVKMLFNFRSGAVACTSDMRKAFLQIGIKEEDRDALRFFWLDKESKSRLQVYRMTRVPFGMVCSSYLLHQTIIEHCDILKKNNDIAASTIETLLNSLYVDDVVFSRDDPAEVDILQKDITDVLAKAGFSLHKVLRNDAPHLNVHEIKVLGMIWNLDDDEIFLSSIDFSQFPVSRITKCQILKFSARVFDPLGLLSPITLPAKYIMQRTWEANILWDEFVSSDILHQWKIWVELMKRHGNIRISRHLADKSQISKISAHQFNLHIFADATLTAFGAAAYVTFQDGDDSWKANLLFSKFRVAPLRMDKIPRMELMAATVAALISRYIQSNFWSPASIHFWSDSTVVLGWIKKVPRKVGTFVINRVKLIRRLTSADSWHHCPGDLNPADIATRPHKMDSFSRSDEWLHGPSWLRTKNQVPPGSIAELPCIDETQHQNDNTVASMLAVFLPTEFFISELIDSSRFSNMTRLRRVTVNVLKARNIFKKNCGFQYFDLEEEAELRWIIAAQQDSFPVERASLSMGKSTLIKTLSSVNRLRPFLDVDGVLRIRGRLQFSALSYQEKHPVLLAANHKLTFLLVDEVHRRLKHAGVSTTLATLRQRFWLITGRKVCRKVINDCSVCRRLIVKCISQPTAPLPTVRVALTYPFACTGIDFAGPALVQAYSGQPITKVYIALFTCASSRAIHLELVSSLRTHSFLMALRRFIGRRGAPAIIYSDNAAQFKRADVELRDLERLCHTDEVQQFSEVNKIEWRWIAERAPWWGGFWERLVKSVKEPLRRTLGASMLNFEELETVLVEIEAIINSRPLTTLFEDPDITTIITPAHILLGRPLIHLGDYDKSQTGPINILDQYVERTRVKNEFLKRWKTLYLMQLRSVHEVNTQTAVDVVCGQVVLLKEDGKPRHKWQLCKVIEVRPGRDGLIRSCKLLTAKGQTLLRPVNLIAVLEGFGDPASFPPPGIFTSSDVEGK